MAEDYVYASGEPYEGPPPPNNTNNLQEYANLYGEPNVPPVEPPSPEPSPHLLVEEISIKPLSDFTQKLHIREAFFEAFPHHAQDGHWHFIEFDLNAAQTRYVFSRDMEHGGELYPRDDFLYCIDHKGIEPLDETYSGEYVDDDLYVNLPDPIPFPWLQRLVDGNGGLRLHIFRRDYDMTPSGYNAEHNTDWFGDDEHWYFYVMFVQDSATTAKMYISWNEEGDYAVPDFAIEEYFNNFFVTLHYCLRPAFFIQNIQRVGELAEQMRTSRRAKQALALSGRRVANNQQLPGITVGKIMKFLPRERKTRKRRRNNRKARKSRRSSRK